jgi:2-oxoglutarate ferredoxin oxidoreductase subunit beta
VNTKELKESIKQALRTHGFRFIEVVSQCPTAYGKRAGFKDAGEMLKWFKENTVPVEQTRETGENKMSPKVVIGEFVKKQRPTLVETVQTTIEEARRRVED